MSKTVCVTGAGGYIATEIVRQLIEKGYNVYGTVRNPSDDSKVGHIKALFPLMKLFEADLLKEGSFDEAIRGVDYVIHAASPFIVSKLDDPQRTLIDPAVNGTKNVLASVAKTPSVKCLVVTSSNAAVVPDEFLDGRVFTENDWNTDSTLETSPYRLSKTLAERYVWEWAKDHPNVRVTTVLPGAVLGAPLSSRTDATSISIMKTILDGTMKAAGGVPPVAFPIISVQTVARTHIACIENEKAQGRYLNVSTKGIPRMEIVNILKKEFGDWPLPEKVTGSIKAVPHYDLSKIRTELGIDCNSPSLEETVLGMARKLVELGIVKKPTQ